MREAMVICPMQDNEGTSLGEVRKAAVRMLVEAFGGCSVVPAEGAWRNDADGSIVEEPVWQLIAACDGTNDCARKLDDVARFIGRAAKQWAVYVRYASGNVAILDTAVVAGLRAA